MGERGLLQLLRLTAVVVAVLLPACPAGATVVPRLRLDDLAGQAAIVARSRILRHWSAWDAGGKFIWTHYVLEVNDAIKGSPPALVTISEPGGTVGPITMQIAGVTRFSDLEEVVVFLHRTPLGHWRTYGYGQGKFTVLPLARGHKTVRANTAGLLLLDRSAQGRSRLTS